ncbi:FAD-dependent monooxygenase [Dactylosporangium sp. CA-139066]|uniref:FAD-dependent monooxygenase n=1 Tax=Dactylosporangium sp. CA-139066 TaxID=3239930 RepID=UPI003D8A52EF
MTTPTQVLVVGAGPTGALLALELAHHGVACLVVERAVAPPRHPGVDRLTGQAMDLLRRLGLADLVRRHGAADGPDGVEWRTRLDEEPVLVSGRPAGGGPEYRIAAAELTRRLREELRHHPLVELREGWTFTGLRIEPGGAVANLLEVGTGARHVVAARHVVGCDGAQSTVRRCLEIPMEGLGRPDQHCSVFFRSADPRLPRRTTLVVGGPTCLAPGDGDSWVAHLPLAADEPVTIDPVAMLRSRLGGGLDVPEVLAVAQWDDGLAVAAVYRRGPVFLAGEAAHRFQPAGVADTSLADAVDLGWKLGAAINGWGGPGLLDSYESERRPRALLDRELLARSLETRRRFGRLSAAGAAPELLAGLLRQEAHRPDAGALPARHATSAVVWHDGAAGRAVPAAVRPGGRAPDVRLDGGDPLADRFGPELTLVDLTGDAAGAPLAAAAAVRGIPVRHLPVADAAVRAGWDRPLALVRPDRHVAWCADAAPGDWDAVLDLVRGKTT